MIRLGGSHTSSARQVVATLSGVCETADEADLEAAMLSERHAEAFLVAQKVSHEFPELSLAEKRAKVVRRLPSGVMSEATESVVRNELTWTDSDDAYLETFSRLTPLDDDQLLGGAEGKPGEMSPRDWIWAHRYHCCAVSSKMLAKFLKVVDWGNHNDAREAREVMSRWYVERPEIALELLGQSFSDPIVRAYAVHHLSSMKDDDLQSYMLQLVQCLKFEQHDNSVLLRFMLRRALRDPLRVGASMFWLLRSELHNRETLGRYGLLLELYVRNCGPHREVLGLIHETVAEVRSCDGLAQGMLFFVLRIFSTNLHLSSSLPLSYPNIQLERVTKLIVTIPKKDRARRTTMAREELARIAWPKRFGTCLTSLHMCSGILIDRCKVMDSKQAPLWIEFANADSHGSNIKVMFKVGDDLRQDQMTLQFLELLDRKSLRTGVDLCMRPYKCVGTGREVGMVEMVPISDTIARMQWAGGGPYDKKPLYDFLLANAKLKTSAVQDAVRAFTQSCAGYTVATYVMGIGDRHPSNIMMQEDGHLFHIDFGHFLGNFKQKKVGIIKIDRERSPVVFTPQMLHVLNPKADKFSGEQVERFLGVCYSTYSLLRDRASEFITLFTLMVTAGLPELKVSLMF